MLFEDDVISLYIPKTQSQHRWSKQDLELLGLREVELTSCLGHTLNNPIVQNSYPDDSVYVIVKHAKSKNLYELVF